MPLDVEPVTVTGRWLRHVPAGRDPVSRPEPPPDNRWQHGAVVDAVYLAGSEACVWAEWYRHLAETGIPPNVALPRDLLAYDLRPVRVADLSTAARLERVGLSAPAPGRAGWPAFQDVGDELWREGWPGLLAPSAARLADRVLCLFLAGGRGAAVVRPVSVKRVGDPPVPPTRMRT